MWIDIEGCEVAVGTNSVPRRAQERKVNREVLAFRTPFYVADEFEDEEGR